MEHYYTQNPNTPHDKQKISFKIKDYDLDFFTDAGVFSKSKVDYGSEILIKSLPQLHGQVLDLGCGYGSVGISIAKMNPNAAVLMIDINSRALGLTRENIKINRIENASAIESNGFNNVNGLFNTIVSNPPIRTGKKVIYPIFEQSKDYLTKDGELYIVIQKKQGAKSAQEKLKSIYGNCEAINKQGGYWILKSIKI